MSNWEKFEEGGMTFWQNETGTVSEADGMYISIYPKMVKLGPFDNLEQAQEALMNNKDALDQMIENFNLQLMELMRRTNG